jgi:Flp pilus assembly protein TadG
MIRRRLLFPARLRLDGRRDHGSLTIELAILIPGFGLLALLAIMFGREAITQSQINLATQDAARAATVARSYSDAQTAALNAATATLAASSTRCARLVVQVQPSAAFAVPVGQPSTVRVALTCDVSLSDLAPLPLKRTTVTLNSQFASPLDQYRFRASS